VGKKSFSLRERYKNAENVPENYVVLHFEGVWWGFRGGVG
jgi:hypothetical protein